MIHNNRQLLRAFDKAKWTGDGSLKRLDRRYKTSKEFLDLLSADLSSAMQESGHTAESLKRFFKI